MASFGRFAPCHALDSLSSHSDGVLLLHIAVDCSDYTMWLSTERRGVANWLSFRKVFTSSFLFLFLLVRFDRRGKRPSVPLGGVRRRWKYLVGNNGLSPTKSIRLCNEMAICAE